MKKASLATVVLGLILSVFPAKANAQWASQDVGAVSATGSWNLSSGVHTIAGSGADIWTAADEFRFTYMTIVGDATITAHALTLENKNVWSKAGVMIRDGLAAGARNATVITSPTVVNGYRFQTRTTTGGTTSGVKGNNGSTPIWLRLSRSGNSFRAYTSTDGMSWAQIGSATTITMTSSAVQVGLAVTSHVDGTLAIATFDNVTVTGAPATGLYVEAEGGNLTSPMQVLSDVQASGGNYISVAPGNNSQTSPPSNGHASYVFSIPNAGTYKVWGRVISPTTSDDSFWVRMDTGTWDKWNNISLGSTWHWAPVTNADASNALVLFTLAAGTHTLEWAYREDGTKLDRIFITNDTTATPSDASQPSIRSVTPSDGATGVSIATFVSADLVLPNVGGEVDVSTLTDDTVKLVRVSDSFLVPSTKNTTGGGDAIVLQPTNQLDLTTAYSFSVTSGLKDLTGASFLPFASSFTTSATPPPPPLTGIAFTKVDLAGTAGRVWTSIALGPDGKLYGADLAGEIVRFTLASDGTVTSTEIINSIITANGGARAVIGLAFDPASTPSSIILWVTHSASVLKNAPDWSGKLSRLTGANLGTYEDVVVNFPRSFKDHMTNSIAIKPSEPGVLYILQGSMSAMGSPDNAWGLRSEHLLSAAVLRLDTSLLGTLPLDIQTNDADPTVSGYNPFAAGAPLTIYASGVRNAYDLVWHSSGNLYVPTNGSSAGGATPSVSSPFPSSCMRRIDGGVNGPYTGPPITGIGNVDVAANDYLFKVVAGGFYGHPNPSRCEWVMNGGNPTSSADTAELLQYPVGTQPDRNWRGAALDFGLHYSPDGAIEWTSSIFPALQGRILVARYSGGDDIVAIAIDSGTGSVTAVDSGFPGTTGFGDPLDLALEPVNGFLYVAEHGAQKITLLRPIITMSAKAKVKVKKGMGAPKTKKG